MVVASASASASAELKRPSSSRRSRPACRNFGGDAKSQALSARIQAHGRALAARTSALFALVAEYEQTEAWRGDGAVSMAAWMTEALRISPSTARIWLRAAQQLKTLPRLADAFAAGALSVDVVVALAPALTPESDAEVVARALDWSVNQARDYAASVKAPTDAQAARDFEHRSLRFNDAAHAISILFPADDYALAKAKLIAGLSWDRDASSDANGEYIAYDQRLYDSYMNHVRADAIAAGVMDSGGRSSTGRATVVVHADLALLMGDKNAPPASVAGGGLIAPEVARRLSCDAETLLSVESAGGTILDQGRLRKEPSRRQRIEIARRDQGCRFSNCTHTDFVHIHHIVHWAKGGPTNLSNLITLCPRHHHCVHELGWKMSGNANGTVSFTNPHGRTMTSVPSPTWRPMRT